MKFLKNLLNPKTKYKIVPNLYWYDNIYRYDVYKKKFLFWNHQNTLESLEKAEEFVKYLENNDFVKIYE